MMHEKSLQKIITRLVTIFGLTHNLIPRICIICKNMSTIVTYTPPPLPPPPSPTFAAKSTAIAKVEKVIQSSPRDAAAMIRLALSVRLVSHLFRFEKATKTVKLLSTFYLCLGNPRFYGLPFRHRTYVVSTAAAFLDACVDWIAKTARYELCVDALLQQLLDAVDTQLQIALVAQPLSQRARYVATVKQTLWPFVLVRRTLANKGKPETNDALVAVFGNDALCALVAAFLCAYSQPLFVVCPTK